MDGSQEGKRGIWVYPHSIVVLGSLGIHIIGTYIWRSQNAMSYWAYKRPILYIFQRAYDPTGGG